MPDKGAAMKRYARMLSAAGFILLAYSVLGQALGYWRLWQMEQGFVWWVWPHWLWIGIGLAGILRLVVTSVLLRRLARPGPAGTAVRWLARFWIIPTLGVVGLSFWGDWMLLSLRYYPAIFVSNPFGQSLLWVSRLVSLGFSFGSVWLFWGLTRERRVPGLGPGEREEQDPPEPELSSVRRAVERVLVWGFFIIIGLGLVRRLTALVMD